MSSYKKLPPILPERRIKLANAGKAANSRRLAALKEQAEAANQSIKLMQDSLAKHEKLLGEYCLPLSAAIATLKEFATIDLLRRETSVQVTSDADPATFYSFINGGAQTEEAIKSYLRGAEVTKELKEKLALVDLDTRLL